MYVVLKMQQKITLLLRKKVKKVMLIGLPQEELLLMIVTG